MAHALEDFQRYSDNQAVLKPLAIARVDMLRAWVKEAKADGAAGTASAVLAPLAIRAAIVPLLKVGAPCLSLRANEH